MTSLRRKAWIPVAALLLVASFVQANAFLCCSWMIFQAPDAEPALPTAVSMAADHACCPKSAEDDRQAHLPQSPSGPCEASDNGCCLKPAGSDHPGVVSASGHESNQPLLVVSTRIPVGDVPRTIPARSVPIRDSGPPLYLESLRLLI
jgi:hypothetical protein